jgi:ribosomal protein S18 acetylase RimI-like enzyme
MQRPNLFFRDNFSLRPAKPSDCPFIESLYHSTRNDLRLIDADRDFIETLIKQQHHAQSVSYSEHFPDAVDFIVEAQHNRIGRVLIDFAHHEIRIIDMSLIPTARGKGYGAKIIKALKKASNSICTPLVLSVYKTNTKARQLYETEGFKVTHSNQMLDCMAWYPNYS